MEICVQFILFNLLVFTTLIDTLYYTKPVGFECSFNQNKINTFIHNVNSFCYISFTLPLKYA